MSPADPHGDVGSQPGTRPPMLLHDAKRLGPFRVLLDLHDHALFRSRSDEPDGALAEPALAAAAIDWWRRWQPIAIHALCAAAEC
jgi:hypothetical protein